RAHCLILVGDLLSSYSCLYWHLFVQNACAPFVGNVPLQPTRLHALRAGGSTSAHAFGVGGRTISPTSTGARRRRERLGKTVLIPSRQPPDGAWRAHQA